jgi:hypothetical protein
MVTGRIEADYSVSPELVSLGVLNPGERKTVNVVVRGKKPFAIEKIESEKTSGTFEVRLPQSSKLGNTYVLPLTVIAPDQPGTLTEDFTVTIAGSSEPVTFKAYGKIVAGGASATEKTGGAGPATAQKNNP